MIIMRMMYDVWQGAATSNWGWLITFFFLLLAYYRHDANVTHVSTLLLGTSLFLTHGFNTAVLLLLRHQCFSKNATGTACWPNRVDCHARPVAWTNRVISPGFITWATVLRLFGCLANLNGPLVTNSLLSQTASLSTITSGRCLSRRFLLAWRERRR